MRFKKVAIIHEVFVEFGGAERVLMTMLKLFPSADVYSSLITEERSKQVVSHTTGKVFTSFFSHIPFLKNFTAIIKPFVFYYWENLDLNKYDLVISLSHSFSAKSVITGVHTKHLSYIFTPPRYLYTEYNETRVLKNPVVQFLCAPLFSWLRTIDYISAQRPDLILADSVLVQKRIQKYYRRESKLLYPAVALKKPYPKATKKEYYLCFSRLVKQKGTQLAIETCNKLKLPLLVVGKGKEEEKLKRIAGPTITFRGFVSDQELPEVFSKAYALINCAIEEDFGMVNVESLAFGVPVIGFNSGGLKEIVTKDTGILFDEYSINSLSQAIKIFQKQNFSPSKCRKRAEFFSEENFQKSLEKTLVNLARA